MAKGLTFEKRVIIERAIKDYIPYTQIARFIGCSAGCVCQEVNRNGGPKVYTAQKAQELSELNRRKMGNRGVERPHRYKEGSILSRILAIEQQVEIILDTIKALQR